MSTSNTFHKRQRRLTELLEAHALDGLALNPGPSLTYLSGLHFHLSERPVVLLFRPGKAATIVLPQLEAAKLEGLPFEVRAFPYGEQPELWAGVFQEAMQTAGLRGKRIGVEARRLRLLELRLLEAAGGGASFLDAQETLAALRMVKEAQEVQAMRRAAQIAEAALQATLPQVRIGMSERELANELTVQLLRHGSHPSFPFSPIVASGPNSANPHATPTDRPLSSGDLVVIDWGANVEGYFSDITRTFRVGEVDAELARVAETVLRANRAAREKAAPGVPAGEVDAAARQVIAAAGYGDYFIHRTGHGLGMEGHEEPYIRSDSSLLLQPGMTFTIEPGIYLPGRGGVRIEDDVLITSEGLQCLTTLPRALSDILR